MTEPHQHGDRVPQCGHHGNALTWLGDKGWRCPWCFPEMFPAVEGADEHNAQIATLQAENDGIRRHGARVLEDAMALYAKDPSDGHIMIKLRDLHALMLAHPRVKEAEAADDRLLLQPTIDAWAIIEEALNQLGVRGSHDPMFRSKAEAGAKAIVARLAHHEPPILLSYATEAP